MSQVKSPMFYQILGRKISQDKVRTLREFAKLKPAFTISPKQRKTAEGAATHINGNANLSAQTPYQQDSLTAIAGGAHA